MSADERHRPDHSATGPRPPAPPRTPPVRALLASCAAADAVSTPPAPTGGTEPPARGGEPRGRSAPEPPAA